MTEIEIIYKRIRDAYPSTRVALSRSPGRASFISYVLRERSRIAAWNRRSGLIRFQALGFRLELSTDYREAFYALLTDDIYPLYARAQQILEEGWHWSFLTVREYNAVVYFVDLCEKLISYGKDRSFGKQAMHKMHESLLRISEKPLYLDLLLSALTKALITHSKSSPGVNDKTRRVIDRLQNFCTRGKKSRSIFSFVIARYMVESRRYLTWTDLSQSTSGEWLPMDYYACSPEILKAIVARLEQLASDIKISTDQLDRLLMLREVSGVVGNSAPKTMVEYYEKNGATWDKDTDDFFLLAFSYIRRITDELDPFFFRDIDVMTRDEKIIKTKIIDDKELEDLYGELVQLTAETVSRYRTLPEAIFSVGEYRASESPEDLVKIPAHGAVLDGVKGMLSYLFQIGVKFQNTLQKNNGHDSFHIRHMIINPSEMRGRPVIDIFAVYSQLLLQFCGYLKNSDLLTELQKISSIQTSLRNLEEENKRLDAGGLIGDIIGTNG